MRQPVFFNNRDRSQSPEPSKRQINLIRLEHLVDHVLDLLHTEHGRGQRIKENGVEDLPPVTLTQSGSTVTNPESFESLPILTLTGEGTVTLTIQGGGQNKSWVFTGLDGSIVCDSEQMNFYSGTAPMNDKVSGDGFPRLQPGVNTISWVGTVTSLVVQPRWVTL